MNNVKNVVKLIIQNVCLITPLKLMDVIVLKRDIPWKMIFAKKYQVKYDNDGSCLDLANRFARSKSMTFAQ